MDIRECQKAFIENASALGDYQAMSKTELANGYCDYDEAMRAAEAANNRKEAERCKAIRDAYHSALMLRYWYKIFEWQKNSSSLNLDYVDYMGWLDDSLWVAFYYRMWRYEYKAVVKHGVFIEWKLDSNGNRIPNPYYLDVNAPDKIINRCCGSMRGRVYQYYNKDKRKCDVQTFSIDNMLEDYGDSASKTMECYTEDNHNEGLYSLVQYFVEREQLIEALIIDGVANYSTFTEEKTETGVREAAFNSRLLVKHLNSLNDPVLYHFSETFDVPTETVYAVKDKICSMNNTKLYKLIDKTFLQIKQTPSLISCLVD